MSPFLIALLGVLAIILILDVPRRILFRLLHLGFLGSGWTVQRLDAAARAMFWVLAVLTLFVLVGVATQNLMVLTVVAVLLGGVILILRTPFLLIPLGIAQQVAKKLANWAIMLFWITVLMLFLPSVMTTVSMTTIMIVTLGSVILKIAGRTKWFNRVLVVSTVAIMAIVIATSMVAPLRQMYTDWRFANMNQMEIVETKEQIEQLGQLEMRYGGLRPSHRDERDRLIDLLNRKQTIATKLVAQRGNLVTTSGWLPELDETAIFRVGVILIMGFVLIGGLVAFIRELWHPKPASTTTH